MALSSFVYIYEVDNLSDARFAAGIGVDLVGFRLNQNEKNALSPAVFREIIDWISGVKIVGEFGSLKPAEVEQMLNEFPVDFIQISDATYLYEFTQLGKPIILRLWIEKESKKGLASTLTYCSGSVEYFLLDSEKDSVSENEKEFIQTVSSKYPLILGYGINISNASSIADQLKLKGIALKGSPELRPGYKEFNELADILETLEVD